MTGFLRPEAVARILRWREVIAAGAVALAGVWLFQLGGLFFQAIGVLVAVAGAAGVVVALRKLRFRREVDQPGVVEVDEGQVRYFGPHGGGFASLADLDRLDLLVDSTGKRWWRLTESTGNFIAVPIAAAGADGLFEAFASLPGLSSAELLAALDRTAAEPITVWRRAARRVLT